MITKRKTRVENNIHITVNPNMACETGSAKVGLSALLGGESAGGYYIEFKKEIILYKRILYLNWPMY
jgi:hypothetical protein